jgi:hypothetical protein
MKKNMNNATHIEGYLYEHDLALKESGPNSKNPGTEYIAGTVGIATNEAKDNIVPVHFTYVTATTKKGKPNATFGILKDIIDGKLGSIMGGNVDNPAKLRIDSAIGLNEWFTDRNGQEELVSVKRNEGGFVHTTNSLNDLESNRNTFRVDMLITGVKHIDADEERGYPEKAIVKGAIFNFRNELLPVEFSTVHPGAISYFEGLEASSKNPVFTEVRGEQISETIVKRIEEASAFGGVSVREVKNSRKDWVITWAAEETYEWDSEESITAAEVQKAMADREIALAAMKQQADEWKAKKSAGQTAAPATGGFNF